MISLGLGLLAALAWGLHDFCVRFVTGKTAALSAFLVVLATGLLALLPLALSYGDWPAMTGRAYGWAVLSGLGYVLGGAGLYNAFAIGPVRLVAPICGAFPVLSVAWAVLRGQPVSLWQWLAVVAVVAGVGLVALWSADHDTAPAGRGPAIAWALAAALGFALTFSLGQMATGAGSALPVLLLARGTAVLGLAAVLLALRHGWRVHPGHWPLLAGMGLLDVLALGAVLAAGGQANPEFAIVTSSVFGIVTIVLAWRLLGERLAWGQWLGVGVVFAGVGYLAI